MIIKTLEVGSLKSNCYLAIDEISRDCIIIDPGDDGDYIQRIISDLDANPISIIATHGHFDHVLACFELQIAYDIPFLIHKEDEFLLKRMQSSAKHFTGVDPGPLPKVSKYLTPGDSLKIGNHKLKIISTPGHTPGSVCLYCKEAKVLFVGDLVFADGYVGRTDFKYSEKDELQKSVAKISKYPKDTTIYPGHGGATTIDGLNLLS